MTTAVAIAYDWLYKSLPASTRKLIKNSIYRNAIARVLKEYEREDRAVGPNVKRTGM